MKISDLMKMGLRNLGRRKARTALTIIGIVIGTISIVVMVSIGIGMNENYKSTIMQSGDVTTVTISRHHFKPLGGKEYEEKEQKLDDKLVEKLKLIPNVKAVSPQVEMMVNLKTGKYQSTTQIVIVDSDVFEAFNFPPLKNGEAYEKSKSRKVIKVWAGKEAFSYFYNPDANQGKQIDPEKARIRMAIEDYESMPRDKDGKPAFEPKEYLMDVSLFETDEFSNLVWRSFMDREQFELIFKEYLRKLPLENRKKAEKKIKSYSQVLVSVDSVSNVDEVQEEIKALGFGSTSLSDITKQIEETSRTMQMVLGGVGAVSMIVAAISIANTMVMSIYERTKEIGIMKVLGCHLTDIRKLFLFEAAMMGLIGGIIGIGLSYGASYAMNTFGGNIGEALGMFAEEGKELKLSIIPLWLPIVASIFAIGIGIISGYYPASRATKISAIEAMKND